MTTQYLHWRKSHRSNPNGECVEVAQAINGAIGVRDSKAHGDAPILEFTPAEWTTFLGKITTGALDLP